MGSESAPRKIPKTLTLNEKLGSCNKTRRYTWTDTSLSKFQHHHQHADIWITATVTFAGLLSMGRLVKPGLKFENLQCGVRFWGQRILTSFELRRIIKLKNNECGCDEHSQESFTCTKLSRKYKYALVTNKNSTNKRKLRPTPRDLTHALLELNLLQDFTRLRA